MLINLFLFSFLINYDDVATGFDDVNRSRSFVVVGRGCGSLERQTTRSAEGRRLPQSGKLENLHRDIQAAGKRRKAIQHLVFPRQSFRR